MSMSLRLLLVGFGLLEEPPFAPMRILPQRRYRWSVYSQDEADKFETRQ